MRDAAPRDAGAVADAPRAPVDAAVAPIAIVSAGVRYTCAAGRAGIRCWGGNDVGQLGVGSTSPQIFTPTAVSGIGAGTTAIAAGFEHACAVVHGAALCWGNNQFGRLGNGQPNSDADLPNSRVPVAVTGLLLDVQAIAAGGVHTCAIVNGGARCWGGNDFGQLGDGSLQLRRAPVAVTGLASGVQQISAGSAHSCAIVNNGAMCWGSNIDGRLGGTSTNSPQPVPVQVVGLTSGVQAIAVGRSHTCAIVNGGVMCWGDNAVGQLGNGVTGENSKVPVQVIGLTSGVVAIAAAGDHTCAVLASGAATCWGANQNGELGNGSSDDNVPHPPDSNTPVQVTGLSSGVVSIATGPQHSCATTFTHEVWCWGFNGNGQLAVNPDDALLFSIPHRIDGAIANGFAGDAGGE